MTILLVCLADSDDSVGSVWQILTILLVRLADPDDSSGVGHDPQRAFPLQTSLKGQAFPSFMVEIDHLDNILHQQGSRADRRRFVNLRTPVKTLTPRLHSRPHSPRCSRYPPPAPPSTPSLSDLDSGSVVISPSRF